MPKGQGPTLMQDQQAGFAGGLNTVSDPAVLRPDQARQMTNFRLSNFGAAVKRLGTQQTNATGVTIYDTTGSVAGGIFWPTKAKIYLFCAASGSSALNLWSTTYSPSPFAHTWTSVGALPQYRPVIFTDGTTESLYVAGDPSTAVYKYDGTTISALGGSTAKVAGLVVYNDRLWGWSGTSLYYSNLSSAIGSTGGDSLGNAAASGGQIVVRTFGMSTIVACAVVGSSLLILHQRGISRLTGFGQDDISVVPQALTADVGMGRATADGVCVYGGVCYFVTDRGIYRATEGVVEPLGTPEKPDPTFPLLQSATTDPSKFTLRYNRAYNELWVVISGVGIYVYNTIIGAWSGPFTGTYATGFRALFEVWEGLGTLPAGSPYGNSHLWIAQYNGGAGPVLAVQECDRASTYKDDAAATTGAGGTAVTGTLQLHRMFAGDRFYSKAWRWVKALCTLSSTGGAPTMVSSSQNGGNFTMTFSPLISTETVYYLQPGGTGPYLDLTITDANTAGTNQYVQVGVEGYFLGQR